MFQVQLYWSSTPARRQEIPAFVLLQKLASAGSQDAHFVTAKYTVTLQSKKAARQGFFTEIRGTFDPDYIQFRNVTNETSEWAGENGEVIRGFHDLLLDLVERIRSAAAAGQGDKFLVDYGGEGMDIRIWPSDTVRGMSNELCERIKMCAVDGI